MIEVPSLNSDLEKFVKDFESLKLDEIPKNFWDNLDDDKLKRFKKIVKDHYKINQSYTCVYCRQKFVVNNNAIWDLEHIIPKSSKPQWMLNLVNLCISCKDCNEEKSNKNVLVNKNLKRIPKKSEQYLTYHPHLDEYDDHIDIVSAGEFYLPRTKKGLLTYNYCGLSRFFLILADVGKDNRTQDILMLKVVTKITETDDANLRAQLLSLLSGLVEKSKKVAAQKQVEALAQEFI